MLPRRSALNSFPWRIHRVIKGIGVDIIETSRIQEIIERRGQRFLDKTFTEAEQKYCTEKKKGMYQSYGARFAAKEAVFKVLGTGWQDGVSWLQIEVTNDELGKPKAELSGRALERAQELGISSLLLSLSHTQGYCTAFAVGEGSI
jgi:holo-[acyl-carrier protein] synthase